MSSKHAITAWAPFGLEEDGMPVTITYTYSPGCEAIMYGTPQPADPASVDFVSVVCDEDLKLPPRYQTALDAWAVEYLAREEGFNRAADHAHSRDDA